MWIIIVIQVLGTLGNLTSISDVLYTSQIIGWFYAFNFCVAVILDVLRIVFEILIVFRKPNALLGYIVVSGLAVVLLIVYYAIYNKIFFSSPYMAGYMTGSMIGAIGFPALIGGLAYAGFTSVNGKSPYRK